MKSNDVTGDEERDFIQDGQRFVRVGNTLVNMNRLLLMQHKPEKTEGCFFNREYYRIVFAGAEEMRLTPEEGALLLERYNLPPGRIDTTSEAAT